MIVRRLARIILPLIALTAILANGCSGGGGGGSNTTTTKSGSATFPDKITGLNMAVAMAFAPDGRIFITQQDGNLRIFKDGKLQNQPFVTVNVPNISGNHESGLLGLALDPNFKDNHFVYFYHSYQQNGQLFNRVVRCRDNNGKAADLQTVLDGIPGGIIHDGGILGFAPDGNLMITTGETGKPQLAQNLNSLGGKTLRIKPDGTIPADNPFPNSPVYSYGHRNVFGLAFNPTTKRPYITENGTNSNDEINIIQPGGNYGWPIVLGMSNDPRFINPIKTYTPEVAPTQALFYKGSRFKDSKGNFFFGSFLEGTIHRLKLGGSNQDQVVKDEIVYTDPNKRGIVGIAEAPDGAIYAITQQDITRVSSLTPTPAS